MGPGYPGPMARVLTADGTVTLALTRTERIEGFHGDITAPVSSVTAIRASDDLWSELRGLRAPGTGIPGVICVCTLRGSFGRDFAVVHGKGPGVVVEHGDRRQSGTRAAEHLPDGGGTGVAAPDNRDPQSHALGPALPGEES